MKLMLLSFYMVSVWGLAVLFLPGRLWAFGALLLIGSGLVVAWLGVSDREYYHGVNRLRPDR